MKIPLTLGLAGTLLLASCHSGRIDATPSAAHEAAGAGDLAALGGHLGSNAAADTTDGHGLTPLFYAVRNRQVAAAKDLLGRGANPNHVAHDGNTPLRVACHRKDVEMAVVLLDGGADLNAVGEDALTPLGIAVTQEDKELLELLLTRGAKASPPLPNIHTPLTLAIIKRDPWYFDRLLRAGADPHQPGLGGNTPLHVACAFGNQHATTRLLAAGVDSGLTNANGLTPLDLALLDHRYDLVLKLIETRQAEDLQNQFQGGDPFRRGVVFLLKGQSASEPIAATLRGEARTALQEALAATQKSLKEAEGVRRDAERRARMRELWIDILIGMAQGAVMAGQQQVAQMNYRQTAQISALRQSNTPTEYFSNYERIMAGHNSTYVVATTVPIRSVPGAATEPEDGIAMLRVRISECQKLLAELDATPGAKL
ncbi:MAG: ankyrin repeat domain-containing protein [Verrucomicrobiales bacterium]|nr:ankyrin repeat domain-containing protein [Verrucomicrobiales bacterium]